MRGGVWFFICAVSALFNYNDINSLDFSSILICSINAKMLECLRLADQLIQKAIFYTFK